MFENERPTKKDRRGRVRGEEDEPLVGKPNLQGVENTGTIPRTYHRSRLQPGSTLFNSCSPLRPFSPPSPKRKEAEKRASSFPPILAYFHLFSLSPSPSPWALCRDIASQTRKWPAASSPFWKMHAPSCTSYVHIDDHDIHTHTHEPSFHSWLGKVFQKTLKMHDIRLVRKRGSTRIDNRVHNSQTLGYRWLGYTCTTRERWEFLGGGGGCTGVSRWIGIRNRRIFCFPFPR